MSTTIQVSGPRGMAVHQDRLIDVTPAAFDIGYRCSVCLTKTAWEVILDASRSARTRDSFLDVLGRVLVTAASSNRLNNDSERMFICDMKTDTSDSQIFSAFVGVGDDGRNAVTISLSCEVAA
jgi:hypothetical protein